MAFDKINLAFHIVDQFNRWPSPKLNLLSIFSINFMAALSSHDAKEVSIQEAVNHYCQAVKQGVFPGEEHSFDFA